MLLLRHYSSTAASAPQEERAYELRERTDSKFGTKRDHVDLSPTARFETVSVKIYPARAPDQKEPEPHVQPSPRDGERPPIQKLYVENIDAKFLNSINKERSGRVIRQKIAPSSNKEEPSIEAVQEYRFRRESSWLEVVLRLRGELLLIRFEPLFLRDACNCKECIDSSTRQKNFQTADIPANITIRKLSFTHGGRLRIHWINDISGFSEAHTSYFTPQDLATYADKQSRALRARYNDLPRTCWNKALVSSKIDNLWLDYSDYLNSDESLYAALKNLHEYGLVFLNNVPSTENTVEHIGQRIGPLRDSFYGRTWDVRSVPDAKNVAYTHQFLGLHMDLLYMAQPPQLQILHSLRSSSTGGSSIFSDAFRAAQHLRETNPRQFNALLKFPVTYHYRNAGEHYHFTRPTIELEPQHLYTPANERECQVIAKVKSSAEGEALDSSSSLPLSPQVSASSSEAVEISDDPEALEALEAAKALSSFSSPTSSSSSSQTTSTHPPIAHINYSPPFQAPFEINIGPKLRAYHDAISAFSSILEHPDNLFELRLEQGQAVIFNNRRVLHGRREFDAHSGERWLKGAYVDVDPFMSRYRVLRERYEPWKVV
ncbi:Clavaminate synthase-like protein [Xylona heveae TC161]|uniref:Clavaminate synthase-like protein n=1 Tax=Xylona heveae (strain CBS 132557 / TC161) TaxID=1328760 RepID=A0A165HPM3_XYLHT|nr:Clavaminate synthase-like protein [Xylona heveae TC161]KZF23805.1 Clavaminate synthase-like protein [Xylona heveae TC161]